MLRSGLRLVLGLACFCISALGEERASETMATLPFVVAMVGETRGELITILAGGDAEPAQRCRSRLTLTLTLTLTQP